MERFTDYYNPVTDFSGLDDIVQEIVDQVGQRNGAMCLEFVKQMFKCVCKSTYQCTAKYVF